MLLLFVSLCYAGDVSVKGYYRKDGTYVAPYHRSSPDNTVKNNYDYKGNTNPYTGEEGHNYYRSNPTSEYYQPSYQPQQRSYNYDTNSNYQYNQRPQTYSQPNYQYNQNNQPSSYTGQTQTIYSNGQAYQVTPQSDGSAIIRDSYGNTYRYEGDE
jgi:hypothetical protein